MLVHTTISTNSEGANDKVCLSCIERYINLEYGELDDAEAEKALTIIENYLRDNIQPTVGREVWLEVVEDTEHFSWSGCDLCDAGAGSTVRDARITITDTNALPI